MSGALVRGEAIMIVEVKAATDLGLKRAQNEDSHGEWNPSPEERAKRGTLLVVADGMGGSRAGEVASRLAVDTVMRFYREAPGDDLLEDLHHAVEAANRVIHRESAAHPEHAGMGTTCTAVVLRDTDAFVAHVGDSRAYLIQDGAIRQLTRDHSLVAQLVREGQLTPEQAKVDPRRNVVTRSVGVGPRVEIDAEHEPGVLRPGDTILICSDGLHGVVADDELQVAASRADLAEGCREAIELANRRGGPDNITVVLARVRAEDGAGSRPGGSIARARAADARGTGRGPAASGTRDFGDRSAVPERAEESPSDRVVTRGEIVGPGVETRAPGSPDEDLPRPYWLREERRRSGENVMLWLLLALAALLVAVLAMSVVLRSMARDSHRLGVLHPAGR